MRFLIIIVSVLYVGIVLANGNEISLPLSLRITKEAQSDKIALNFSPNNFVANYNYDEEKFNPRIVSMIVSRLDGITSNYNVTLTENNAICEFGNSLETYVSLDNVRLDLDVQIQKNFEYGSDFKEHSILIEFSQTTRTEQSYECQGNIGIMIGAIL